MKSAGAGRGDTRHFPTAEFLKKKDLKKGGKEKKY
jgi:hypothetical protein